MNLNKLESLLAAFETDVRFPDTSGMEHFDMLLSRTRLENNRQHLTAEQKERLAAADEQINLAACTAGLNIGCGDAMASNSFWSGLIDEIRIYSRAVEP